MTSSAIGTSADKLLARGADEEFEATSADTPAGGATTLATELVAPDCGPAHSATPEAASSRGSVMSAGSRIAANYRHTGFQPRVCRVHNAETSSTWGSEIWVPGRKFLKSRSGLYCCNSHTGTFSDRFVMLQSESPRRAIYTSVPVMRCEAK